MMPTARQERRKKPRVQADLAAQISDESRGRSLTAETVNVSTAGVCCQMPNRIDPLTKVRVTLLVPDITGRRKNRTAVVRAEGVVVRSERKVTEEGSEAYEVACSFTLLEEKDRKILQSYVDKRPAGLASPGKTLGWQGAELAVQD